MTDCSIIMTVRHEPLDRLADALAALRDAVDFPDLVELVLSAPPGDATAAMAASGWPGPYILIENPTGERSVGLNLAAEAACGEFLVRIDARTRVPVGYVRRCVEVLRADPAIGVVGGHQLPMAGSSDLVARSIARALQNPCVVGAPAYRVVNASGPVETVYLGVFRRDEFIEHRGYDEGLLANEDFDLCQRYLRSGQVVWLVDGLNVEYVARATAGELWGQYRAFGRSKVAYWRRSGQGPIARQLAALVGAGMLVAAVAVIAARPKMIRLAVMAGPPVLVGIDAVGNRRAASAPERLIAGAASLVIMGAWLSGLVSEAIAGAGRHSR